MANRGLRTQFRYSMFGMPVDAFAKVTFGASGAPTLNVGGQLIASIVRTATGTYTITFKDIWPSLLMAKHVFNSGASAPAAPAMYIKADSTSAAAKTLQIVFNLAGTATDPASGEIAYLDFIFNNSSITG